jgi:hypothetical protein
MYCVLANAKHECLKVAHGPKKDGQEWFKSIL